MSSLANFSNMFDKFIQYNRFSTGENIYNDFMNDYFRSIIADTTPEEQKKTKDDPFYLKNRARYNLTKRWRHDIDIMKNYLSQDRNTPSITKQTYKGFITKFNYRFNAQDRLPANVLIQIAQFISNFYDHNLIKELMREQGYPFKIAIRIDTIFNGVYVVQNNNEYNEMFIHVFLDVYRTLRHLDSDSLDYIKYEPTAEELEETLKNNELDADLLKLILH
jgi:hypothetical protein